MPTLALIFPNLDPVALQLGPLAIRWYSLAYIAGLLIGFWGIARLDRRAVTPRFTEKSLDDLLFYCILGVVLGGRLGYVLFYKAGYYFSHPAEILEVWQGGMSFHGGFLGVMVATYVYCRKYHQPFFGVTDRLAVMTPVGLFLGRLANFVNGELYGRITDVPWGMIFPHSDGLPRHPSQLYQAGLEGLVLGAVLLFCATRKGALDKIGYLSGVFLIGYGTARIIGECFREPDAHLGFLFGPVTMGQLLSLPMILFGIWLIRRAR